MPTPLEKLVQIEANWAAFEALVKNLSPKSDSPLLSLVNERKNVIAACPASSRTEYQGCYPGGLVEHSLRVVRLMGALNKVYGTELSLDSIIITGLFHDIGKIGNEKQDYYTEKDSDWHRKQGMLYDVNPSLAFMPVAMRSLAILSEYGVRLKEQEVAAISSIKDRARMGDDSLPSTGEPMLSVILQQSVKVACIQGKGRTSVMG